MYAGLLAPSCTTVGLEHRMSCAGHSQSAQGLGDRECREEVRGGDPGQKSVAQG